MNKQLKIGLVIIFVILLLVCVRVAVTELPKEMERKGEISYRAYNVKTHLYIEQMQSPQIDVLDTLQQLYDYSNVFSAQNLDEKLDKYTNTFFDNKSLIVITIQEGSGSITNSIGNVRKTNASTLDVTVNRKVPEVGTMDMAMHHLIIEVSKKDMKNITNILVNGK